MKFFPRYYWHSALQKREEIWGETWVSPRSGLWDRNRRKCSFPYLVLALILVPHATVRWGLPQPHSVAYVRRKQRLKKQYDIFFKNILCFFPHSGSASQMIKVYNLDGGNLSTIRYHDGFMGQRIGPISCLEFHPHRVSRLTPFLSCVILYRSIYFTVALSSHANFSRHAILDGSIAWREKRTAL